MSRFQKECTCFVLYPSSSTSAREVTHFPILIADSVTELKEVSLSFAPKVNFQHCDVYSCSLLKTLSKYSEMSRIANLRIYFLFVMKFSIYSKRIELVSATGYSARQNEL